MVVGLHVVADGLDGEDDLRTDLLEAIEDSRNAEVRRRRAPDGPDGGGGSHGLDGQRAVGQIADDLQVNTG